MFPAIHFPGPTRTTQTAASPAPARNKKFVLIPNTTHGDHWKWSGNDSLIRDFLFAAAMNSNDAVPIARAENTSSSDVEHAESLVDSTERRAP